MYLKIGYARVSTRKQDLELQVNELKSAGVDKIYKEKFTGTSMKRPVFEQVLNVLKSGDVLVVTKLDRLARNTQDALKIATILRDQNVALDILNMGKIDNSPIGNLTFTMFSAFAQFERDLIVARTEAGKEWAREHKPNFLEGRPRKYDQARIAHAYELRKKGYSYSQLEDMLGISRATLYRRIQEYKYRNEDNKQDGTN